MEWEDDLYGAKETLDYKSQEMRELVKRMNDAGYEEFDWIAQTLTYKVVETGFDWIPHAILKPYVENFLTACVHWVRSSIK